MLSTQDITSYLTTLTRVHTRHCIISDTYTRCPHMTLYHIRQHLHVVHTRHCITLDNTYMSSTQDTVSYRTTYTLSTQDIASYMTTPTHVQIDSPSWTCMLCTTEAPSWLLFGVFHSCTNCSQVFRVSAIMCTPLFILLTVLYNSSF